MKKYRTVLIIGRFQPFHNGHLYLLKKALLKAEKVIFAIGSASIFDENNPLSFEQRKKIIETVVKNEGISNQVVKIIPLEDFYNDKKWLENLHSQVGNFDVAMGNNEWTNNILKKAGHKVLKIDHYKRYLYEGWRIRKLIWSKDPNWQKRVPNYIVSLFYSFIANSNNGTMKQFKDIVLGGTFDHFHIGHENLLKKAFELGKKVTIGIATEELYQQKFLSEVIEPFEQRKKSVNDFLSKNNWLSRSKITIISNFKGEADKAKNIEAIIVSKSTYPNALKINQLREIKRLSSLRIVIINDVIAQDGKLVSSERIRAGEINRKGQVYINFFKKTLILSQLLKEELRKPIGKIYKSVDEISKIHNKSTMLITVGDIISENIKNKKIVPDMKIIDYRSRRQPIEKTKLNSRNSFTNEHGTINIRAVKVINLTIRKFLTVKKPQTIVIKGEEDLLALPSILLAPLNSLVLYGHWQLGIIAVVIDEKIKNKVLNIINKFI